MGKEAFQARAPAFVGDILWEHLELLQKGKFLPYNNASSTGKFLAPTNIIYVKLKVCYSHMYITSRSNIRVV